MSILSFLLSVLLLYKYWALFGAVLLSAIIVPIPVNSLLLAAGAFASQGYFSFAISLLVAVAANIFGDCIDFFLARRYGRPVLRLMHVRLPTYFERLEAFVKRYPGAAIFVTRFVGTIEPLTSLLCGFIGVGFKRFLAFDLLGNAVSIGSVLYAGYFLGSHWQDFTGLFNITDYMLIGIIVLAAIAITLWHKKKNRSDAALSSWKK